jgi:ribosome-associated protein
MTDPVSITPPTHTTQPVAASGTNDDPLTTSAAVGLKFPGLQVDEQRAERVTPGRDSELYARSLANACTAARIADELRGQKIVVLDMTGITAIVDFFVIVTGNSRRQMHAIADEVNRKLKHEDGNRRISVEGYRTEGHWILTDYGDVVLHVFTAEGRELYQLEQLWSDARRIDWQTGLPVKADHEPEG